MVALRGLFAALAAFAVLAVAPGIVATPATAAVGDCTPGADWPAANSSFASEVVSLVNDHRTGLGLGALSVSGSLTASAVWKARHMAEYGYMQHSDPAPPVARSVGERLEACGYTSGGWGENIAYGYSTPAAVVQAWLASPGHRANIENASYTAIGVGAAQASGAPVYWAQDFGTAGGSSPPPTPPSSPPSADPPPSDPPPSDPAPDPGPEQPSGDDSPPEDATPPTLRDAGPPAAFRARVGRVRAGGLASLAADDGVELAVRSKKRKTVWIAAFTDLPDSPERLVVAFRGASTRTCTNTLSIWDWDERSWTALDRRRIGRRETAITVEVGNDAAEFVGGASGTKAKIRAGCVRTRSGAFTTRTDLLQVAVEA